MNEEEKEIIREIRGELEDKKHLTPYEKGQLDLIKRLRKKKPVSKLRKVGEKIVIGFVLTVAVMVFLSLIIFGIPQIIKENALEKGIRQWEGYDRKVNDIVRAHIVNENKAVAFININCEWVWSPCDGEFIVEMNKINNRWVVNESSKRVIW